MSSARFSGRVCIVTGAGSGLGRATALRLGSEGAHVACLDLALEHARRVAIEIEATGTSARAYEVDVADPKSVRAAVDAVVAEMGRPQVLINCAGTGRFANSHEMSFEDWSRIIAVNLTGTFLMAQAVLPHLMDGGGNIVNIASNAGVMGIAYGAAYCASKGGVVNLTRALSDEYVRRGVRVNAVAPGGIATPFQNAFRDMPQGADLTLLGKIRSPLGMAEPDEVASLIAFIASDEGRYMTGAIVSIDGGITT